ncbi:unnamed protein product, partial [Allacma fusca]
SFVSFSSVNDDSAIIDPFVTGDVGSDHSAADAPETREQESLVGLLNTEADNSCIEDWEEESTGKQLSKASRSSEYRHHGVGKLGERSETLEEPNTIEDDFQLSGYHEDNGEMCTELRETSSGKCEVNLMHRTQRIPVPESALGPISVNETNQESNVRQTGKSNKLAQRVGARMSGSTEFSQTDISPRDNNSDHTSTESAVNLIKIGHCDGNRVSEEDNENRNDSLIFVSANHKDTSPDLFSPAMDYTPFRNRGRNAGLSRTEISPWKEEAHSRITSTKDSVILKKRSRDRGKRGRGSDDSDENHLHESDPKKHSMGGHVGFSRNNIEIPDKRESAIIIANDFDDAMARQESVRAAQISQGYNVIPGEPLLKLPIQGSVSSGVSERTVGAKRSSVHSFVVTESDVGRERKLLDPISLKVSKAPVKRFSKESQRPRQGSASSGKSGRTSIPNLRGSPIIARKSAKETAQAAFRG